MKISFPNVTRRSGNDQATATDGDRARSAQLVRDRSEERAVRPACPIDRDNKGWGGRDALHRGVRQRARSVVLRIDYDVIFNVIAESRGVVPLPAFYNFARDPRPRFRLPGR